MKLILLVTIGTLASGVTSAASAPSGNLKMTFPVSGNKSNIGSFWGDARDGGKRKHEGIDIFASKGTPAVAILDGRIISVGDGGIGGKTVYLQPDGEDWYAYYAHLDRQDVVYGQRVKKGQQLGTVGNTGNAATTPPHLHFGIYTDNGAIDPLPYIKNADKVLSPVKADKQPVIESAKDTKRSKRAAKKSRRKSSNNEIPRQARDMILNNAVNILLGKIKRN